MLGKYTFLKMWNIWFNTPTLPQSFSHSPWLNILTDAMLIQYFNPKRQIFQAGHVNERTGVLFT